MAFFPSAFEKVFVATQISDVGSPSNNTNLSNGFVMTSGLSTAILNQTSAVANSNYGVGSFGFFDAKTYNSVIVSDVTGSCCPLVLASAAIYSNDAISPTIGGMQETNKSKMINPKYVSKFYRTDPCTPQQQIVHIGNTKYTKTLSPVNADCCFEFLCGETYTMRLDIKGSPALRFLNHNLYRNIDFYTGCCADPTPEAVDSSLVMIGWANYIINDPLLSQFISPIVYDEAGLAWYAPGTVGAPRTWDNYDSPGHTDGLCAGLRLLGAYTSTNFLDCTFQTTDFFEKEPIKIYASMVDFNGDPCTFTGICVVEECPPLQGMGFGDTVLRELILSESYRQNYFNSDLRIREITQGNQEMTAISRTASYYRYTLIHSVPRLYNPSGVFDNDQYRLEIITSVPNTAFETFVETWLETCSKCTSMETFDCSPCTPLTP